MRHGSAIAAVPISESGCVRAAVDCQSRLGSVIAVAERWKTLSNEPARPLTAKGYFISIFACLFLRLSEQYCS